jgi:hypothetical protein
MKGKELLNIRKSIEANRQKIVDELYDWARTFEDELDEDGEPT